MNSKLTTVHRFESKKGLAPAGEPLMVVDNTDLAETYSLTLLTRYGANDDQIALVSLREDSNTQWDFFRFVLPFFCFPFHSVYFHCLGSFSGVYKMAT
jgi:hypothetical protein